MASASFTTCTGLFFYSVLGFGVDSWLKRALRGIMVFLKEIVVRKMMMILVFAMVLPAGSSLAGVVEELVNTNFSGGFPAGATVDGNWEVINSTLAFSGSQLARITGPTQEGGDVFHLPVSSLGYQNITLITIQQTRLGLEKVDGDSIQFESTYDGINWGPLKTYDNSTPTDWEPPDVFVLNDLAGNNEELAFRWVARLSSGGDEMRFGQVIVTGQPVPEPAVATLVALGGGAMFLRRLRYRRNKDHQATFVVQG